MEPGNRPNIEAANAGFLSVAERFRGWIGSGQAVKDLFFPGMLLALLGTRESRVMQLAITRGVAYPTILVMLNYLSVIPDSAAFLGGAGILTEEILGAPIVLAAIAAGRENIKKAK